MTGRRSHDYDEGASARSPQDYRSGRASRQSSGVGRTSASASRTSASNTSAARASSANASASSYSRARVSAHPSAYAASRSSSHSSQAPRATSPNTSTTRHVSPQYAAARSRQSQYPHHPQHPQYSQHSQRSQYSHNSHRTPSSHSSRPSRRKLPLLALVLIALLLVCVLGGAAWALVLHDGGSSSSDSGATLADPADTTAEEEATPAVMLSLSTSVVDLASTTSEINLFSCVDGTSEVISGDDTAAIESAVASFTNAGYSVGFVLIDLYSGLGIARNAATDYFCASTIKAPYVTYLQQCLIDTGDANYTDTLIQDISIGGTGVMADEAETEYSLETVMYNTIVYSDNTGYGMLRNYYAAYGWDDWTVAAGVDAAVSSVGWYPYLAAGDLMRYWITINEYLQQESGGDLQESGGDLQESEGDLQQESEGASFLMSLFDSTEVSFLRSALPSTCTVYAKAGFECDTSTSNLGACNEAGLVVTPTSAYLVAIMSDADYSYPDLMGNADIMEALALALYDAHESLLVG